jgi:hypothetical protein
MLGRRGLPDGGLGTSILETPRHLPVVDSEQLSADMIVRYGAPPTSIFRRSRERA